jgi:hypothetical protein
VATKWRPPAVVVMAIAVVVTTLGVSTPGAGARTDAANDKFCAVVSKAPGQGLDFDGLAPDEASFAATLIRKAAKTGVSAKLKTDFAAIAKLYDRVARGEPAANVLDAKQQKAILPGLMRFSKYVAANCVAPPT